MPGTGQDAEESAVNKAEDRADRHIDFHRGQAKVFARYLNVPSRGPGHTAAVRSSKRRELPGGCVSLGIAHGVLPLMKPRVNA